MMRLTMCRGLSATLAAAAALLLSACSATPPLRFYTLAAPAAGAASQAAAQPRSTAMFIDMMPVGVPERLTRPQLVVQSGGGRVDVLEQDRWSAPFNNELRDTLANGIAAQLGAVDIRRGARQAGPPVYRIAVDLRQFDAIEGDRVDAAFGWTVSRSDDGRAASCQLAFSVAVAGGGTPALVAAMQQSVATATAAIVTTVGDLRSGNGTGCR
jgi:uncharacterized lipoprotein YmbA